VIQHPGGTRNLDRFATTTRPFRLRHRLLVLTAVAVAVGLGISQLLGPRSPVVVTQPRSIDISNGKACDILTHADVEALVGPLLNTTRYPRGTSCDYNGKDGRSATLSVTFHHNLNHNYLNTILWQYQIAGNTAAFREMPYRHRCSVYVWMRPPPDGVVLGIAGRSGVTCGQVTAAATAAITHLPPA
jgi:hypothetical protein